MNLRSSLIFTACTTTAFVFNEEFEERLVYNTREMWAPIIDPIGEPMLKAANKTYRPAVIVHGMGDSGTNPGMKSLCNTVSAKYPGIFTLCSTTADGAASITTKMDQQLEDLHNEILSHPELSQGFNAVGLSQGNFLIEAYVALVNDPPVHNFVSICGPLEGEATCPDNLAFKLICPLWKLDPYGAPLAFSGYWKGTKDRDEYVKKSQFLAKVLNELDTKNETVTNNFKSLNSLLMIEATKDTMIEPKDSEQHGMWQWGTAGSKAPIVSMRDSDGYQGDWIGLQTLDKAGKIKNSSFVGQHIRFTSEYWNDVVLPELGNYLEDK
eukprot:CAMPEP_0167785694 /NCGR_PEP_ID=MMETSP0111_2-20121227/8369_1 /TAXON_ID=91324 /ORGANISM="Lotharella globosa, Strain CCCM811" /LENGTH=323 /DNA_ID=CAMNT_0007676973 /DNA_START=51 /DNA_END=1022 /DNA_ORIENTATION=-